MSRKPIVAVTMGDPAGVGPEVILKALNHRAVGRACNPLILGDWGVLQRVRARSKRLPELISWQSGMPLLPLLRGSGGFVVCPLSTLQ